jgi:hypothetical protein
MALVRLSDLFNALDGHHFDSRRDLERAVLEIFNEHVAELPIGYSYKDAIEGARLSGWLDTNGGQGTGVTVRVQEPAALAQ